MAKLTLNGIEITAKEVILSNKILEIIASIIDK